MLAEPIWTYTHLAGWRPLITQLIADLNATTRPHAFLMVELKERYDILRLGIEPVDEAPVEIVAAKERSAYTCIDCGASAMLHEWNTDWILRCCPNHARARARHVTSFDTGPGWRLKPESRIVNEAGGALSEAQTKALDLGATRQERRIGRAAVVDPQAADWRAARWMAGLAPAGGFAVIDPAIEAPRILPERETDASTERIDPQEAPG
jgi:hypothetical protein